MDYDPTTFKILGPKLEPVKPKKVEEKPKEEIKEVEEEVIIEF